MGDRKLLGQPDGMQLESSLRLTSISSWGNSNTPTRLCSYHRTGVNLSAESYGPVGVITLCVLANLRKQKSLGLRRVSERWIVTRRQEELKKGASVLYVPPRFKCCNL